MTINDPQDDPLYQVGGNKYKPLQDKSGSQLAEAKTVNEFHKKDDVDSSFDAHHHTLGTKNGQAASGDHNHDGKNSRRLLQGTTITGAKGGNAAVASIVAALVKLGAVDSTTA